MTYKQIINRIRTVAQQHLMIKDFGYGELSDIKTQAQFGADGSIDPNSQADYPYMFLLPGAAVRNEPVMNYSFSMIMMDMARSEEGDVYDNYLTIQSQCQQYIDDVLANLYYGYRDQPEVTLVGITYTPFKEKYQDEVAGMTANFTIQVPAGLNDCIAPIQDLTEEWNSLEYPPQTFGSTFPNDGQDLRAVNNNLFLAAYITPSYGTVVTSWGFARAATFKKVVYTFDMEYLPGAVNPVLWDPTTINNGAASSIGPYSPNVIINWPTVTTPGIVYNITLEWNNVQVIQNAKFALWRSDIFPFPPNYSTTPTQVSNGVLKLYEDTTV